MLTAVSIYDTPLFYPILECHPIFLNPWYHKLVVSTIMPHLPSEEQPHKRDDSHMEEQGQGARVCKRMEDRRRNYRAQLSLLKVSYTSYRFFTTIDGYKLS
jgi:hypothetical protein